MRFVGCVSGGSGRLPRGGGRATGWVVVVLLVRSLREMARNSFVNGIRMAATLVLAGLFGVVWGDQQSVVDRIGSVVMVQLNLTKLVQVNRLH